MVDRWRRNPAVLWRRSLDAVLVLSPSAADPLTLAGTGAGLWDLLAEPTSTEGLVTELAARHAADPSTVGADLLPVLDRLADVGIIEVDSSR